MRGTFHDDHTAGLRLIFPKKWSIVPGDPEDDLQKWLTTAAYPPPSRQGRGERNRADAWGPTEQELWEEAIQGGPVRATAPDPTRGALDADDDLDVLARGLDDGPDDDFTDGFEDGTDDESDDDLVAFITDLYNYLTVYVGVWEGLPEEPPGEEELLGCADWLAEWFMKPWEWFVPDDVHGLDHSIRKVTIPGHHAAAAWYRYIADDTGRTAAYLRLLLIRRPSGATSFVLGVAQSDADRRLVDGCLDSVELLAAGPAG